MGQEQGLHRACLLAVRRLPDAIKQLTCLHMFNRQDGESADATGFLHIFATQQEEVAAARRGADRGGIRHGNQGQVHKTEDLIP